MCDINEKYRNKLKRVKECYEEIITEMKKEDVNNFVVKDWIDEKEIIHKSIVFIFACPGREEFIGNKPCCGQTGKNLYKFINHFNLSNKEDSLAVGIMFQELLYIMMLCPNTTVIIANALKFEIL